jgi:hypothetical protein
VICSTCRNASWLWSRFGTVAICGRDLVKQGMSDTDPSEQLRIISGIRVLLSRLEKDASANDQATIAEIMGKLNDLERSLRP